MARWTDKPAATTVDDADLLLLADVSEPVGTRDRTLPIALARLALSAGLIPRGDTASRPSAPGAGLARLYFDEDLGHVIVNDGTNWLELDGSSI